MSEVLGKYVQQLGGYKAFIPTDLGPNLTLNFGDELKLLLSEADRAIAKLDGVTTVLPNPDLFVAMYVKKEALLSSQIEGTQASLEGVLEFENNILKNNSIDDINEVINYIKAINFGIKRLKEFPMSLKLIKEIHEVLLKDTRGKEKNPGEFRKTQNWIGPAGFSLQEAVFIPPPPETVMNYMGNLERFLHAEDKMPPLIKIALVHYQFETIHPFLDGNGRIGRMLIALFLIWKEILSKPVLYLSYFLKKNKDKYYSLLMDARLNGELEKWVEFFLKGIIETSVEAINAAKEIIILKDKVISRLYDNSYSSIYAIKLIDLLFTSPYINAKDIKDKLKVSKETSSTLIRKFDELKIIKEITGKERFKRYVFKEYIEIIEKGTKEY